jgi:multidrug efflux pump subunit AcrA (membrane-fusion protein)
VQAAGDKYTQMAVLAGAKTVANRTKDQVNAARARVISPNDRNAQAELDKATVALREALAALLAAASGADVGGKDMEDAITSLEEVRRHHVTLERRWCGGGGAAAAAERRRVCDGCRMRTMSTAERRTSVSSGRRRRRISKARRRTRRAR